MSIVPEAVAGYKVYYGGTLDLVGVADVTLSDLEPISTSIKGPGILGEVNVPIIGQLGALSMSMNFRTISSNLSTFAEPKPHSITLRAAIQELDASQGTRRIQKVRIECTGSTKKVGLGKMVIGEGNDSSVELELTRFQLIINDVDSIEIDKLNNVYKVNSVDMLGELNNSMGR